MHDEQQQHPARLALKSRLPVFPVGAFKIPSFGWLRYQTELPTDVEGWIIDPCWQRPFPAATATWKLYGDELQPDRRHWTAWAFATGRLSGIFALDFDGGDGLELLRETGLQPHVRTPSNGFHVYVSYPPSGRIASVSGILSGFEVRGDGGYVSFAGCAISCHGASGVSGTYEVIGRHDLYEVEDLPTWFQNPLPLKDRVVDLKDTPAGWSLPTKSSSGRWSTEELLEEARKKAVAPIEGQSAGNRNQVGLWLACQLRDEGYPKDEAGGVMREYQRKVPGTGYTVTAALRSLESAYSRSPRSPRGSSTSTQKRPQLPAPELKIVSGEELMGMDFPDVRWPVKGLIHEGATLLSGPEKAGKTALGVQLALAVANGRRFLERFETTPGRVLYVEMENGEQLFQELLCDLSTPQDNNKPDAAVHLPPRTAA